MQHILFISTHNLATNPRLQKEIKLALSNGFKVSVICFEFNNWSKQINDGLLKELSAVNWIILSSGRTAFLPWLQSVFAEKLSRFLGKTGLPMSKTQLASAVSRRNYLLLKALQNVESPDLVVGHNPGALFATYYAAHKFRCRAGFDVEDYHPGEGSNILLQELCKKLMQKILPEMDYVSFAAPLIREAVKSDLGAEGENWITVLNYFPADEFKEPVKTEGPLKMVWFSQNIAARRGLEMILPIIKKRTGEVELHLFGNLDANFEPALQGIENIKIHGPLPQKSLHQQLCHYDIGLALEPSKDRNNDLAVSNKLLTYLQAGLYVLASNTAAQEKIGEIFPAHCSIFIKDELEAAIKKLLLNMEMIRADKRQLYETFQTINWDSENKRLLNCWKK